MTGSPDIVRLPHKPFPCGVCVVLCTLLMRFRCYLYKCPENNRVRSIHVNIPLNISRHTMAEAKNNNNCLELPT